jgi:hypothetical protein
VGDKREGSEEGVPEGTEDLVLVESQVAVTDQIQDSSAENQVEEDRVLVETQVVDIHIAAINRI